MESSAFGEPVLGQIADLRGAMEVNDWRRALQFIAPLRRSLERIDPRYSQRLTEVVLSPLAEELKRQPYRDAQRAFGELKAALAPLPWDPNWNRFQALLWEGDQGDPEQAIQFWRKYLDDLDQGAASHLGVVKQVQALVWLRIGEIHSDLAADEDLEGLPGLPAKRKQPPSNHRTQATEALQRSLQLDPTQREARKALLDNYDSWDQPERLIAALEDLLKAFPDDVDALRQLIEQYQWRDEPELFLNCVARLRTLRPLDTQTDSLEAWGKLAHARRLALKNRFEEAREELTRGEAFLKEKGHAYRGTSLRAALEFRAGETALAEEYVERGRATLKEPTVLWLSLAIDAVRYQLIDALRERFNREFQKSLGIRVTSETAGELASLIVAYFAGRVEYVGRAEHLRAVIGYLNRTKRLKYRETDLRNVCLMLQLVNKDDRLLAALSKRGQKLFPRSPIFLVLEAENDLMKGPLHFKGRQIQNKLEKALGLAKASQNPADGLLIPEIKKLLARVRDVGEMMASLPFMPNEMPDSPDEFLGMLGGALGQFEEDDFEDGEPQTAPSKRPASRRKPR